MKSGVDVVGLRQKLAFPNFNLEKMPLSEILRALNNPTNWKQFIRRKGQPDSWTVNVHGVAYRVTAVSEKLVIVRALQSDDLSPTSTFGELTISEKGVSSSDKLPKFRELSEWVIRQMARVILTNKTEGRMKWRRLPAGRRAHSAPPDFLLKEGVPREVPGHTFVHG